MAKFVTCNVCDANFSGSAVPRHRGLRGEICSGSSEWACELIGDTTGINGRPRRIRTIIDGRGGVVEAIKSYMLSHPRLWEWLGVEVVAVTPLGQRVCWIVEAEVK